MRAVFIINQFYDLLMVMISVAFTLGDRTAQRSWQLAAEAASGRGRGGGLLSVAFAPAGMLLWPNGPSWISGLPDTLFSKIFKSAWMVFKQSVVWGPTLPLK